MLRGNIRNETYKEKIGALLERRNQRAHRWAFRCFGKRLAGGRMPFAVAAVPPPAGTLPPAAALARPFAAVSMRHRSRGGCCALICITPASGQWAGGAGSVICMGPGGGQWGGVRRTRWGGDVCLRAGRRGAAVGAGDTARGRGGRGDLPGPAGTPRHPPGLGSATAAAAAGKMSVAGLKKQFHKASQVRAAAPAAVAPTPRGLCRWWVVRPAPAAAGSSTFSFQVAASLSGTSGVFPSALPLGPPLYYCLLGSRADPCRRGLPAAFFCLGLRVFPWVVNICYLMLGSRWYLEASVKDVGCRVLVFSWRVHCVVLPQTSNLLSNLAYHVFVLKRVSYVSRVFPPFLDAVFYLFLGEPSSFPNPFLSGFLVSFIVCFSLILLLISLKRETPFCQAGGRVALHRTTVPTQSPMLAR